ncbi:putative necrosis-inducing factor-domain-containing protein [Sordaria brevicollis]|uniref:Necrosis-inducing factor-domain-containing protein n=1 Tax=Sordaria brevicollis TaxID=83679 RepID=A0AAE0U607_SORBR|nr:putative necrosis-inducing factor-domain-containing protein [Sordaria brevicollis]
MQTPSNLLTYLLTSTTFLSAIVLAAPTGTTPSANPLTYDPLTYHNTSTDDPNDPAIDFFNSLPPPPPHIPKRTPNPLSPSTTGLSVSKRDKNKDWCKGGGYYNATSEGSPWVDDCKIIIQNITPNGGTWHYMTGKQRTLVSHKSCGLGIQSTAGVPAGLSTLIGDKDITEWIQKSIERFASKKEQGKVGSYGDAQCTCEMWHQEEFGMRWGLYRMKGFD